MPMYVDFTLKNLKSIFNNIVPVSQWKVVNRKYMVNGRPIVFNANGLEKSWECILQCHNFLKTNYGVDVMSKSLYYLPQ